MTEQKKKVYKVTSYHNFYRHFGLDGREQSTRDRYIAMKNNQRGNEKEPEELESFPELEALA